MSRVFILGLDGASHRLMDRWMDEGRLPAFGRIVCGGAWGVLRSSLPLPDAESWSEFLTGAGSEAHRAFGPTKRLDGSYSFRNVDAATRSLPGIWKLLSDSGLRFVVAGVPGTYPPEPIEGIMISGPGAPGVNSAFVWPPEEKARLLAKWPGYQIDVDPADFRSKRHQTNFLPSIRRAIAVQLRVLKEYLSDADWDAAMWVCRAPDVSQHFHWRQQALSGPLTEAAAEDGSEVIAEVYAWMNRLTDELLEFVGPDTDFIVMSTHGCGPPAGRALMLNSWLASEGLLTFNERRESTRHILAREAGILLSRMPGVHRIIQANTTLDGIDWSRTKAYSEETQPSIRINLKGREPQGTVSPGAEYEELRSAIAQQLRELKDPINGRPVAFSVLHREQIFSGPHLDVAPDIVFTQDFEVQPHLLVGSNRQHRPSVFRDLNRRETEVAALSESVHRPDGILLACGPHIAAGSRPVSACLQDLAPTLLAILGIPPPSWMHGRALSDIVIEPERSADESAILPLLTTEPISVQAHP